MLLDIGSEGLSWLVERFGRVIGRDASGRRALRIRVVYGISTDLSIATTGLEENRDDRLIVLKIRLASMLLA